MKEMERTEGKIQGIAGIVVCFMRLSACYERKRAFLFSDSFLKIE